MRSNGARPRVDLASAIRHLRKRLAEIEARDSRHRPHWNQADLDAVAAIVDIPASAEQIALARINGIARHAGGYAPQEIESIRAISGKALGL